MVAAPEDEVEEETSRVNSHAGEIEFVPGNAVSNIEMDSTEVDAVLPSLAAAAPEASVELSNAGAVASSIPSWMQASVVSLSIYDSRSGLI